MTGGNEVTLADNYSSLDLDVWTSRNDITLNIVGDETITLRWDGDARAYTGIDDVADGRRTWTLDNSVDKTELKLGVAFTHIE